MLQETLADATRDVVHAAGGRAVSPEKYHLTLAFVGSVPEADLPKVVAIGDAVAGVPGSSPATGGDAVAGVPGSSPTRGGEAVAGPGAPKSVEVVFDAVEYWREPRIICATARAPGAASAPLAGALAVALKTKMAEAGFASDLRPFRTHVTLARKVPPGTSDRAMQSVVWTFSAFALIDSRPGPAGSLYSVLSSWPLYTEVRKMPENKDK